LNVPADEKSSKKLSAKADKQEDAAPQISTSDYKVKSSETLARIAERHHLTVTALAELNGIPSQTKIQAGDTISVPAEEKNNKKLSARAEKQSDKQSEKQNTNSDAADKMSTTDYKVKSGETLARIAAKHGLTVVALADMNSIPSDTRIHAGDTISVPEADKPSKKKGRG